MLRFIGTAGTRIGGMVLLLVALPGEFACEADDASAPGADGVKVGADGAGDASLPNDTGDAGGGDAAAQDVAPSPCGETAPTCFERPYGGCCMQDQQSPAHCGDAGWECAQGSSVAEACPDFCPSS